MSIDTNIKTFHIDIAEKRASNRNPSERIVCGNPFYLQFSFDADWDTFADATKKCKIKFRGSNDWEHLVIDINNNVCKVPALFNVKTIYIGVFIDDETEDSISTTTAAVIDCEKSIRCGESTSVIGSDALDDVLNTIKGEDGKSAYDLAVETGYTGTLEEWVESLAGKDGIDGKDGVDGIGISSIKLEDDNLIITLTNNTVVNLGNVKGADGLNGKDGTDGVSITKSEINEDGELIFTFSNAHTANVGKVIGTDGKDGTNGKDGDDGVGISDITFEENNLIITLSNGTRFDLGNIKGKDGIDGINGKDGINGQDGISITKSEINENGELILTFSDGNIANVGNVIGPAGNNGIDGVGIQSVKIDDNNNLIITLTNTDVIELGNIKGSNGIDGVNGKSAYELALEAGFNGSLSDWLGSLNGKDGVDGSDGKDGADGLTTSIRIGEDTYSQKDGIIDLPESLLDVKIGLDFITDITVGRLSEGTQITKDMSFGYILNRILCCQHDWEQADCNTPRTCKLCGKTEGAALGHDVLILAAVAPTCTTTGLTEGKKCSVCGDIITKQNTVAALGHDWTGWSDVSLADCTTPGEQKRSCNRCGTEESKSIAALGHNYEAITTLEPTCTEEGVKTHICSRCGDSYTSAINVLGHSAKPAVIENEVAATCTEGGTYDSVEYCSRCNVEVRRTAKTSPALGHSYGDWTVIKAPAVGSEGKKQKACSRCGDIVTETIPAIDPSDALEPIFYTGPIANGETFDYPEYWEDESTYKARCEHYCSNMTANQLNTWDDLLGQNVYTISHELAADDELEYYGQETTTYSAIVINSKYKVTAWSTDAAGSYPATDILALEMDNGYTIYYAQDEVATTAVNQYYITIEKK